jgi:uncharacterized damage-inducible protein DinB
LTEDTAVARAVFHALELAQENVTQWGNILDDEEINARPAELPSFAFHVRHIGGSIDRLLTYAEGDELSKEQLQRLKAELDKTPSRAELLQTFDKVVAAAVPRIRTLAEGDLEQPRTVGRLKLPTTLGGLLVHIADHTQRHAGQAVVTAKVVLHARGIHHAGIGFTTEAPRHRD